MAIVQRLEFTREPDKSLVFLKRAIWGYFLLLIFEGALRKWVLPGLATPLLIVRDPIALIIILKAGSSGFFYPNGYVKIIWIVSFISFIATLFFGHGNLIVAVYGLRIFVLHFPLMFIIARVFSRDDVIALGKVLLVINVFMTILVAIQFFSPQSAWVNRGIGGDLEGSGFSGAGGFYRVPGTFSFTNGLSMFYGFVCSYLFFFWLESKRNFISKLLLIVSTISLVVAIPLSISRTVVFQIALCFVFLLAIVGRKPLFLGRLLLAFSIASFLVFILNNFEFFKTATSAFLERFTTANATEGGVEGVFLDRFLGGMISAITNSNGASSFWGLGMGMGTNAGAKLMTGSISFLIAEGEWGRLIGEMGLYLGLLVIGVRVALIFEVVTKSWKSVTHNNFLPWLLLSFSMLSILQGQWAQPTSLGFSTLSAGLVLASMSKR